MVFGLVTTVKAADEDEYDQPLTITGLTNGDVAHFYHVVEWVESAEGNVAGWKAVAPFDTVLTEDVLKAVLVGTPAIPDDPATTDVDETTAAVPPTGITSELAGQLAKAAKTATATDVTAADSKAVLDIAATESATDGDFSAAGLYMAVITPVDQDVVYNPVFVAADFNKDKSGDWAVSAAATYSDKAAAKKSTVSLEKTATVTEDNWDDAKWTTVAIGDTVSYTVTTMIPGYGLVYENPVFKITDKLTDLTLVSDSVVLTAPTGLTDGDEYTIAETTSGYTIEFDADYLKTVTVPTAVTVTYSAIVSTTAPVHVNTEKNEVSTEFNHNPSDESDHGFKKDDTNHYTFTLDANGLGSTTEGTGKKTSEYVKVAQDANGNPVYETTTTSEITSTNVVESPLEGAEFKLYTDADCTNEYVPKNTDGSTGTATTFTTGADGRFTITGLDAGDYYLKETKAPAGFVKDTTPHHIEIIATTSEKTVTEWTKDGVTWIKDSEYQALAVLASG